MTSFHRSCRTLPTRVGYDSPNFRAFTSSDRTPGALCWMLYQRDTVGILLVLNCTINLPCWMLYHQLYHQLYSIEIDWEFCVFLSTLFFRKYWHGQTASLLPVPSKPPNQWWHLPGGQQRSSSKRCWKWRRRKAWRRPTWPPIHRAWRCHEMSGLVLVSRWMFHDVSWCFMMLHDVSVSWCFHVDFDRIFSEEGKHREHSKKTQINNFRNCFFYLPSVSILSVSASGEAWYLSARTQKFTALAATIQPEEPMKTKRRQNEPK